MCSRVGPFSAQALAKSLYAVSRKVFFNKVGLANFTYKPSRLPQMNFQAKHRYLGDPVPLFARS
jgi:hypothetical protein